MNNKINEISSSDFRTKIKSLGFTEKGQELTSGGEINSAFLDILSEFFTEWKKIKGDNCPVTFTSGNDKFHKGITKYTSRHTKGEAVDVVLSPGCHSKFIELLNKYKSKYYGFSFIDEYTNPTSEATGGHFHLSYRSGAPENSGKSGGESSSGSTGSTGTEGGGLSNTTSNDVDIVDYDYEPGIVSNLLKIAGFNENDGSNQSIDTISEEIKRIKTLMK